MGEALPGKPFLELVDRRPDGDGLAGQLLLEVDGAEDAEAAGGDDLVGGVGRDEVPVLGERDAAGARGPEEDLVLLEIRRLQHDAGAVRERPLGDADLGDRRAARRSAPGCGLLGNEGRVGRRVLVGGELLSLDLLEDGPELRLGRDRDARLLRAGWP